MDDIKWLASLAITNNLQVVELIPSVKRIETKTAFEYCKSAYAKQIQGDKKGAISDCDQTIAIDPKHALAYPNRGMAKCKLVDLQGGLADFKIAAPLFQQQGNTEMYEKLQKAIQVLERQ